MSTQINITVHDANGVVGNYQAQAGAGRAGTPTRIRLGAKSNVELLDATTGRAPQVVSTKRVGKDLLIAFEGGDVAQPDVVVEDYYDQSGSHLIGIAESGQYYEFVPTSGSVDAYAGNLAEGVISEHALGGAALAGPTWTGLTAPGGLGWLPWALAGLGAAALLANAMNDDDDKPSRDTTPPAPPVVTKNTSGELSGTAEPGSIVTVTDPSDGSKVSTVTRPDGTWSIQPNPLEPGDVNGTVTATDPSGNVSPPTLVNGPDITPPGPPVVTTNTDGELGGTAEPGSVITVTDPSDGSQITTVTRPDGTWSIQPNPLEPGDTNGTVTATDPSGNVSPPALVSRPDTTPPGPPVVTTNTDGELGGTAEPGTVITVTDPTDGSQVTTVTGPDGTWSIQPNPLEPGDIDGTVTATDPSGNVSPPTDVDRPLVGAPVITGMIDDEGGAPGPILDGGVSNDRRPTINGTAPPGSTVTIYDNGAPIGTTVADANGNWSFTPSTDLPEGEHDFTATATDAAGNESAPSNVWDVTLDYTPPPLEVTGNTSDTLSGTSEPGAIITVVDPSDGSVTTTVADANGNWSMPNPLEPGDTDAQVTATDPAGNTSPPLLVDFGVLPPGLDALSDITLTDDVNPIAGTIADGATINDTLPTYSGKAIPGITSVNVYDNGVLVATVPVDASGNWSYTPGTPLPEGSTHNYTASAVNAGGEGPQVSGTPDAAWTFIIDTIAPVPPTLVSLSDNVGIRQYTTPARGSVTDDQTPTFVGTSEPGSTVKLFENGVLLGTVLADASGNWFYILPQPITEGSHNFTAIAVDAAGNESLAGTPWTYVVDITPPNVGVSINTGDALGGQTEPGALVTVINASGQAFTTIADANGDWIIGPNPLATGEEGTIRAVDPAGNQGPDVAIQGGSLGGFNLVQHATQVNSTTVGEQSNPQTATLADGRIVVVWQSFNGSFDVFFQLYDPTGTFKIGTEQQINQRNVNNQDSPQVAALADGSFVVVWESFATGQDTSGDGVMARRYKADGTAMTDEFLVNNSTQGGQIQPSVAALPDGGYVVSWISDPGAFDFNDPVMHRRYDAANQPVAAETIGTGGLSNGQSGGTEIAAFTDAAHAGMYVTVWSGTDGPVDLQGTGVIGQLHNADGTPLGSPFQVNTSTSNQANYPDVITLKDGSFVVMWDTDASGSVFSDIRAAHYTFDSTTGAVTLVGPSDFLVTTQVEGKQYKPTAVALNDGGYMVIWGSEGGDGSGSALFAQRFDANDNKLGREFLVNPVTLGNQGAGFDNFDVQNLLDATVMQDGNVFVTWQSDLIDSNNFGIEATVIDIDAGYYSEFKVNTTTSGFQERSATASLPNGGFVTVWQSDFADGSDKAVMGQLYDAMGMPLGGEFRINTTTDSFQGDPSVAVLADGTFQVVWTSSDGGDESVMSQHYGYTLDTEGNVNGAVALGAEAQVNTNDADAQKHSAIVALDDGGYLVAFKSFANGNFNIVARQYDAQGVPVTSDFLVSATDTANDIAAPSVATLSNGLVAFAYEKAVGGTIQVYTRVYDPASKTASNEFVANQIANGTQGAPSVAALSDGNFVVTFESNDNSGFDQSGFGVWGRIFRPDGTAVTNEFLVNTSTPGDQRQSATVARPDGGFVTVWVGQSDPAPGAGSFGVYAQYFDNAGQKVGQQLQIHQLLPGDQLRPDVTFLDSGKLFVTWTDYGVGDQSDSAVKGRLVDLDETLGLTPVDPPGTAPVLVDYVPAKPVLDQVNGTSGHDVLDGRGASTINGGAGDDWMVVSDTDFDRVDGGDGSDHLVWDSHDGFNLAAVATRLHNIEGIHLGNNVAQTLTLSATDVLDVTSLDATGNHVLRITGDAGEIAGVADAVDIDLAVWTAGAAVTENGVSYAVYTSNTDSTVKLWVQNGLGVI